jgi:hypothetical protein
MNILFLSMEFLTIGGVARHDRLAIAALDRYVARKGSSLSVASLNDDTPGATPPELQSVSASHFTYSGGSRGSYVSLFCSAVRKADLILYGHVAFAPLRLLQTALNPKAKSLLMLHGIEA